MSKFNFSRNIFLEKEELVRLQEFLQSDVNAFLFKNNSSSFGIISQSALSGSDFLVVPGTSAGTFKIANDSVALNTDMLLLSMKAFDNYSVTNNSLWYWVKISQRYLNTEVGIVSVNTSGQVSGVGTFFTDVLRSQTTKAPVKIRFYKENVQGVSQTVLNSDIYEVVGITDDNNIVLSGSFTAETGLSYIVVGSFSLGASLTNTQKEGIYSYDNCRVSLVVESTLDTPPSAGYTVGEEFYIARVNNIGGTLTIQDKRADWWNFSGDSLMLRTLKTGSLNTVNITLTNGTPVVGSPSSAAYANITLTSTYYGSVFYDYHIADNVNMIAFNINLIASTGNPINVRIYDSASNLIKTISSSVSISEIFLAINTGTGGWLFISGTDTEIDSIVASISALSLVALKTTTLNAFTANITNATPVNSAFSVSSSVAATINANYVGTNTYNYHIDNGCNLVYFTTNFTVVYGGTLIFNIYNYSNVLIKSITATIGYVDVPFLMVNDGTKWIELDGVNGFGTTAGTMCQGNDARLSDARELKDIAGVTYHTKKISIGTWDMNSTDSVNVAHGIANFTKIISVYAFIYGDDGTFAKNLCGTPIDGALGGECSWEATNITLERATSGLFDSALFQTTPTINAVVTRGYVIIKYLS